MGSRDLRRIYGIEVKTWTVFEETEAPGIPWAAVSTGKDLRFTMGEGAEDDERLLLLNLGAECRLRSCSDPLMAPPAGYAWRIVWSSDDPIYGGDGTAPFDPADLRLPPHALLVLAPAPVS